MTKRRKFWRVPLFLSGLLILSQAFPLPGPVRDAATGLWPAGFYIQFPLLHLLFTPFCSTADYLTLLSVKQAGLFVGALFIAFILFFSPRKAALAILLFVAFVAWGALVPRPMAKLRFLMIPIPCLLTSIPIAVIRMMGGRCSPPKEIWPGIDFRATKPLLSRIITVSKPQRNRGKGIWSKDWQVKPAIASFRRRRSQFGQDSFGPFRQS